MRGEPIQTNILSVNIIPNVNPYLAKELKLPEGHISLGLISTDCDDVSYVALDEATKKARVEVVYARSLYAGSSNASTKLAGEFLGIISGDSPSEVRSGLEAAVNFIKNDAHFYTANDDGSIVYFAQCISRTGSFKLMCAKIWYYLHRKIGKGLGECKLSGAKKILFLHWKWPQVAFGALRSPREGTADARG